MCIRALVDDGDSPRDYVEEFISWLFLNDDALVYGVGRLLQDETQVALELNRELTEHFNVLQNLSVEVHRDLIPEVIIKLIQYLLFLNIV